MATRKLNGKQNDHAMNDPQGASLDILEASLSGNLMATLEHLQKVLMGLEQRIHDIEQELYTFRKERHPGVMASESPCKAP